MEPKPKKILTVDDDEDLRNSLSELLSLEGFETVWAKNGQVALDYMLNIPESELPDLVLLDYMMPVMNGQAFVEAKGRYEKLSGIPVVVMTAGGNLINVMEKIEHSAGGYMAKPMDLTTVVSMVKHFTGQESHP